MGAVLFIELRSTNDLIITTTHNKPGHFVHVLFVSSFNIEKLLCYVFAVLVDE